MLANIFLHILAHRTVTPKVLSWMNESEFLSVDLKRMIPTATWAVVMYDPNFLETILKSKFVLLGCA